MAEPGVRCCCCINPAEGRLNGHFLCVPCARSCASVWRTLPHPAPGCPDSISSMCPVPDAGAGLSTGARVSPIITPNQSLTQKP